MTDLSCKICKKKYYSIEEIKQNCNFPHVYKFIKVFPSLCDDCDERHIYPHFVKCDCCHVRCCGGCRTSCNNCGIRVCFYCSPNMYGHKCKDCKNL